MVSMLYELLKLVAVDAVFLGLCILGLVALSNYKRAAYAVMRRNFVGYFNNPTGYVFLCLFVLMTSAAAFCPHDFFAANLANLDQLNKFLPYIMLIFIPAITMSIWAEERRQGTDELLLTLPANDFDIVTGKYLAAAAIFTCSLLFSQFSNYAVLIALSLGDLDTGLLMSTYFGYWLVGMAMISLGMVASFLTSNLTVGFILGALFNAPLAFASFADTVASSNEMARGISKWSLLDRLEEFGRGVISMSSLAYFLTLVVIGLYLSMVLIGRRHWSGGSDGTTMIGHYIARAFSLAVLGVGLVLIFSQLDMFRWDVSENRVSSLSPQTRKLLADLDTSGRTIYIDAFLSAEVPDDYVQTKLQLVSLLEEFKSRAGGKISLTIRDTLKPLDENAELAAERYGIVPETIRSMSRGKINDQEVILGAVFRCGLDKVVVPFFDYGIPVEYELIRSICTVAQDERKKVGVVRTEANMFGGFSMAGGQPQNLPRREIINELEKQYDVRDVNPGEAIDPEDFDALLIVQPSSLAPEALNNVMAAIRAGVPTAIFEDPQPQFMGVPGTSQPLQSGMGGMMGMMGGGGGNRPKADIRRLWNLLGIKAPGRPGGPAGFDPDIVWQAFNPYPKLDDADNITDGFVFASTMAPEGAESISNASRITSDLGELFFPLPGAVEKAAGSQLKFKPLVKTNRDSGLIQTKDYLESRGMRMAFQLRQGEPKGEQILAAHITGYLADDQDLMQAAAEADKAADAAAAAADAAGSEDDTPKEINVVYVADTDLMASGFLRLRARPNDNANLNFRFENVTFLLNLVDVLTGDDAYVDIRKRKPHLSTLRWLELQIADNRRREVNAAREFRKLFEEAKLEAEKKRDEDLADLQKKRDVFAAKERAGEQVDYSERLALEQRFAVRQSIADNVLQQKLVDFEADRDRSIKEARANTERTIRRIKATYKAWSLLIPPIPPLLVGLIVFVQRRLRERETVARDPSRRR